MEDKVKYHLAIVVPCYNEEGRIPMKDYVAFLNTHPECYILFVNDGSTDSTERRIQSAIENIANNNILTLRTNLGKGNAIREGVNYILQNHPTKHIAYLDADLATPLSEILRLDDILTTSPHLKMVFGSRILTINNSIERKTHRHYLGRIIATFISKILNENIYDTQCGAKVFTKNAAETVFKMPFISRWLFDVEIFMTLKKESHSLQNLVLEVPLRAWKDVGKSKVSWSYSFKVWWDLLRINSRYK